MSTMEEDLAQLRARTAEYLAPGDGIVVEAVSLVENRRVLEERAFYPRHEGTHRSAEYMRVRNAMIVEEDLPCRICAVRNSTLSKLHANPYRAVRLETHHRVIEWAASKAIDIDRFNEIVVQPRARTNAARYGKRFTRTEMLAWIDHDRDNLWVLCDVHHRHRWFGVHSITGPVWETQRFLRDEIAREVRRRVASPR